jgi:hypothetical protein
VSDEDIRALFHRIDDGPPLGLDVRDVMTRGRRTRTRRRALTVAGSTFVVAAAVVVSLSVGGRAPAPDTERPAGPTTPSTVPSAPPANGPGTGTAPQPPTNGSIPLPINGRAPQPTGAPPGAEPPAGAGTTNSR